MSDPDDYPAFDLMEMYGLLGGFRDGDTRVVEVDDEEGPLADDDREEAAW